MIITARITDLAAFGAYGQAAAALVAEMGGEYIVMRPAQSVTLEGAWDDNIKTVVSKWPDYETAYAFWTSEAYAKVKKLREKAATDVTVRLHDMAPA